MKKTTEPLRGHDFGVLSSCYRTNCPLVWSFVYKVLVQWFPARGMCRPVRSFKTIST